MIIANDRQPAISYSCLTVTINTALSVLVSYWCSINQSINQ